jgi:hypothetical protein
MRRLPPAGSAAASDVDAVDLAVLVLDPRARPVPRRPSVERRVTVVVPLSEPGVPFVDDGMPSSADASSCPS